MHPPATNAGHSTVWLNERIFEYSLVMAARAMILAFAAKSRR